MLSALRYLLLTVALALVGPGKAVADVVPVLTIDGAIGPATAEYISQGLADAQHEGVPAVVLRVDTPGGLDTAMRDIIRAILASDVPVLTWVGPSGARAASAGTYILYASHVAAMAPGTNLGAATPVRIGGMPGLSDDEDDEGGADDEESGDEAARDRPAPSGDAMTRKMVNDAVAYLRSLAELRDRNPDWAERAVREGASLSSSDAVAENVVDFMADSIDAVLAAADGRVVSVAGQDRTLATADVTTELRDPDWRTKLLSVITNPNIAYILMLVGIYGLIFELANPGAIVPGVIGGICLLLALFALQALPVNYAGLALMGLGVIFMLAEALVPSFGALGVGGVAAFALGSLLLFDAEGPGFELSMALVGGVTAASLVIFLGTATLAARAWQRRVVSGAEGLVGSPATVIEPVGPDRGRVRTHGESWQARSDAPIEAGARVIVESMDGLLLWVSPAGGNGPDEESTGGQAQQ